MSSMFRAFATSVPKRLVHAPLYSARNFHASAPALVKVGDTIPNVELVEDSPGNKVSIANELKGKGVIIGVPAAFSKFNLEQIIDKSCRALTDRKVQHVPRRMCRAT